MVFKGSKKTVPFEEISSTADELIIRSVFIRKTSENDYLIYYKVAAKKKANAFGNGDAFFNVEFRDNLISKLNILVGKKCNLNIRCRQWWFLIGKNVDDIIFPDLTSHLSEGLIRDIVSSSLQTWKILPKDWKILSKRKDFPQQPFLKSTQYVSYVDGFTDSDPITLGKSVPHIAGLECACGQALFVPRPMLRYSI